MDPDIQCNVIGRCRKDAALGRGVMWTDFKQFA